MSNATMTSHEMLTTYASLSDLTGTMLDAARRGEWDDLAALEQRCQGHVSRLTQAAQVALTAQEQRARVAIIRTILNNDAQIRALVEPRMDALQQRLHTMRSGQRGMMAYGARHA